MSAVQRFIGCSAALLILLGVCLVAWGGIVEANSKLNVIEQIVAFRE